VFATRAWLMVLVCGMLLGLPGVTVGAEKEKKVSEPLFATFKTSMGDIVVRLFDDKDIHAL